MFFDTPIYFVFLTVVVLAYWRLGWRSQNRMLLVASYIFYGWWDPRFLALIALSTVVDFYCARAIAATEDQRRRRTLLAVSLVINLGFLGAFKYFNFFIDSFAGMLQALGFQQVPVHTLQILLPPGISFYTFQEVAYIVDVYQRKLEPSDSLVDYALFISLFPHLIAGPIQRPGHLLPQVQRPRQLDGERFLGGMLLILSGLFRKVVIADNCALLADAAFSGRMGDPTLPVVLIGTYAFAWQIYGDFSGYSDIARGSAQLLGFHFMVNFRQPYLATSLQDFWRRWHISLSTWLRDYLYIPLGGNRGSRWQTNRNLMVTMVLGGLWHGAAWTFVLWGAYQGLILILYRAEPVARLVERIPRLFAWLIMFHLTCLGWLIFRAPSTGQLRALVRSLIVGFAPSTIDAGILVPLLLFTLPLILVHLWEARADDLLVVPRLPVGVRYCLYTATAYLLVLFGNFGGTEFIYFQF